MEEKILGNICFFEQIFYKKQSLGAAYFWVPKTLSF